MASAERWIVMIGRDILFRLVSVPVATVFLRALFTH